MEGNDWRRHQEADTKTAWYATHAQYNMLPVITLKKGYGISKDWRL